MLDPEYLAERVGFEPTWGSHPHPISSRRRYDRFGTSPKRALEYAFSSFRTTTLAVCRIYGDFVRLNVINSSFLAEKTIFYWYQPHLSLF